MPNNGTIRLEAARKYIKNNWEYQTDLQLATHLGLNIVSIRRLRYRLGLIRKTKTKTK